MTLKFTFRLFPVSNSFTQLFPQQNATRFTYKNKSSNFWPSYPQHNLVGLPHWQKKDQTHLPLALDPTWSTPNIRFSCFSCLALPSQSRMPHCLVTENLVLLTGHCDYTSLGLDTCKHTDCAYSRGCTGEQAPPPEYITSEWSQARNRNFPELPSQH